MTDEGSLPELRIWSILLIKSDLKWCIYLSRGLFLYLHIKYEVYLLRFKSKIEVPRDARNSKSP